MSKEASSILCKTFRGLDDNPVCHGHPSIKELVRKKLSTVFPLYSHCMNMDEIVYLQTALKYKQSLPGNSRAIFT